MKIASWIAAATPSTARLIETALTPSRERTIERSTSPCEWPCPCGGARARGRGRAVSCAMHGARVRAQRSLLPLDEPRRRCSTWKTACSSSSRDVRVVERVDHVAAAPLADDEPEMTKHAQLMRDRRCLHPDRVGELVHRAGALAEPGEDAHAARRRERLHRLGHLARGLGSMTAGRAVSFNTVASSSQDS